MSYARSLRNAVPILCALLAQGCEEEEITRRATSPSLSVRFGGPGFQTPSALAVDGPDLVVVGTFAGALVHEATRLEGRGGLDGFVVGLSHDGRPKFARAVAGEEDDAVIAVAAAPGGGVVVGGQISRGAPSFPAGPGEAPRGAAFVARLQRGGEPAWTSVAGGQGYHAVTGVAAGAGGATYAVGDFSGRLRWGADTDVASDTGGAFVMRLDARGEIAWVRVIAGSGLQRAFGVATLPDGSVVVAGAFTDTLASGGAGRPSNPDLNETPFLARYTEAGELAWLQTELVPVRPHAHHAHGGADGHAHPGQHLDRVAMQPGPDGDVLVAVSSSSALSHEGLEAPALGTLITMAVSAGGEIQGRIELTSRNALVQLATPFVSGGAGHLFASWTGALMLPDGPLTSDGRRSLVFLRTGTRSSVEEARWFGVEGAGLSARDIVATEPRLFVLGHWQDPGADDADVFLATFPR